MPSPARLSHIERARNRAAAILQLLELRVDQLGAMTRSALAHSAAAGTESRRRHQPPVSVRTVYRRCVGLAQGGARTANHIWVDVARGKRSGEIVMRTALHVSKETLTALVNIATLAIVVGSLVAVRTQSMRIGLAIGATVYVSASLGFLYSVWRLYRPRSHGHA